MRFCTINPVAAAESLVPAITWKGCLAWCSILSLAQATMVITVQYLIANDGAIEYLVRANIICNFHSLLCCSMVNSAVWLRVVPVVELIHMYSTYSYVNEKIKKLKLYVTEYVNLIQFCTVLWCVTSDVYIYWQVIFCLKIMFYVCKSILCSFNPIKQMNL